MKLFIDKSVESLFIGCLITRVKKTSHYYLYFDGFFVRLPEYHIIWSKLDTFWMNWNKLHFVKVLPKLKYLYFIISSSVYAIIENKK